MWELEFFDGSDWVGTFDYDARPEVGTDYGDCVVVEVLSIDTEALMASVRIEYK